jgi:TRAP-type mannitol/chloroaromatic compound transport system permease small subunit
MWPGLQESWADGLSLQSLSTALIILTALIVASIYVLRSSQRSLRQEASAVTRFNTWLVRGLFWAVVFIGLADMAISFLRVEDLLPRFFEEDMVKKLGRPQWRGQWVHFPLLVLGMLLALVTRTIGFHWLALLIVVAELAIVFTRFVFSYEQAFMGDLVRLWYAALFLFASAYTLLHDGHVRVDVLYSNMRPKSRAMVNAIGAILFGVALCWTIILIGFAGKTSIIYGPMANFEVSQNTFGLYTKYMMAGFLGVFAITMMLQFVAQWFDSWADIYGEEPARDSLQSTSSAASAAASH